MAIEQPSDDQLKAIEAGAPAPLIGSKDGVGSSDHNQPYTFGREPKTKAPFPFTILQFSRLLRVRGRIWEAAEANQDHPNLRRLYPNLAPDLLLPKRRKGIPRPYGS